jgi:predicted RecA/RadA family phage recombinase
MSSTLVTDNIFKEPYLNTSTAIASGGVVILASGTSGRIAIAEDAIAATTGTGTLLVGGVHTVTKVTADNFTQGSKVYWDSSATKFTTTSGTNTYAGRVWGGTFGTTATTGSVALNVP